jgi:hypothetical protein
MCDNLMDEWGIKINESVCFSLVHLLINTSTYSYI